LTWNPDNWEWAQLPGLVARVGSGETVEERWSSGNTKTIPLGSRVFLLKQGHEPRGIMASGWTTEPVEEYPHWDSSRASRGDLANYVGFAFELLLDPAKDDLLDPRDFAPGAAANVYWAPPASGTSIPSTAAAELELLWSAHANGTVMLGNADTQLSALEGETVYRMIRHRSRERALRNAKIRAALEHGSLACEVPGCGFDFQQRYGQLGKGYAQVHHRTPLASLDAPAETILSDLAIVCANCHAMIHLGGDSRPLDSLIT
jgi:Predicted restriction endonuclease